MPRNPNEMLYSITPQKVTEDRWSRFLARIQTDQTSIRQALNKAIDWYISRPTEPRNEGTRDATHTKQ
jgi:hypothetical protein